MFKNKIAGKLALYFAVCLIVFSLIIGTLFVILFKNYTIEMHKNDLKERAVEISQSLSNFMSGTQEKQGNHGSHAGYGAYLQYINDIAMSDVWIIDENYQLITKPDGHYNQITYKDLPENADIVINKVFNGETSFSENFSQVLKVPTLTVGTPIKSGDKVIGVVLLHSPVEGINSAIKKGFIIFGISIFIALIISFLLSLWLSKNFTDPIISKEAAEALKNEKLRTDFIANISHELRTPITVIRGSLEALYDEVVTDPIKVKEYHLQMLNESKSLQLLVGDLLDLSRLQNTDFAIEMQEINFCHVIEDAVRSANQIAAKKNIKIKLEMDNKNYTICGDYGRLRQMLLIILDNAIKFSKENEVIEIVLKDSILSIRDYGIGIPENDLPYIFDRFYKSRSEQNKTGTGLGLAIAKQIATRHGIKLAAENAYEKGAKFIFKL
ncbi:sensor histidine kinase [Anaerovorax odorimutans]|uniref:sensor histidine kinase n=1 Tax=Anaerovorax odorimutans TaxID=109327 RepID=UPI0004239310|nr:ATP-binding protein [Anaerovorax odorimutans]